MNNFIQSNLALSGKKSYSSYLSTLGLLFVLLVNSLSFGQTNIVKFDLSTLIGVTKSKVKSRIILTPQHPKRLLKAMGENIHRFEMAHGEIKDSEQPPIPLNFGPTGQA